MGLAIFLLLTWLNKRNIDHFTPFWFSRIKFTHQTKMGAAIFRKYNIKSKVPCSTVPDLTVDNIWHVF